MLEFLNEYGSYISYIFTFLTSSGFGWQYFVNRKLNKAKEEAELKASQLDNQIKETQAKGAEIDNTNSTISQWKSLYDTAISEKNEINEKLKEKEDKIEQLTTAKEEIYNKLTNCRIDCAHKERVISELNWYRCDVNGCPHRKPPRKYGDYDYQEDDNDENKN